MKTPTIVEVMKAAEWHYEKECKYCAIKDECEKFLKTEKYRDCMRMFLAGVIARKLNLDGTPIHGEKPEPTKPALPKWCIEGQWVTPRTLMRPMRIIYIDPFSHKIDLEIGGDPTRFGAEVKDYLPIRFRYPTLQEAYSWLGKVMDKGNGRRELICIVDEDEVTGSEDEALNGKMLFINGCPAECLQGYSIDGHPFGVPEVDEDAMKGETK